MLDKFPKEIEDMAKRIAKTEANHLVFRCTFNSSYNTGTVEQVCDHLTRGLRSHVKNIKGNKFKGLTFEISEIRGTVGKEMNGYFLLLKKK